MTQSVPMLIGYEEQYQTHQGDLIHKELNL